MSRELSQQLIIAVKDPKRGVEYQFEATFQFLRNMQSAGLDAGAVHASLASGVVDPILVHAVLTAALFKHTPEREDPVVEVIERFGLFAAATFASEIISRAVIGDIKKSESGRRLIAATLMDQVLPRSSWTDFAKVGLFLAAVSTSFGILGCLIFNAYLVST